MRGGLDESGNFASSGSLSAANLSSANFGQLQAMPPAPPEPSSPTSTDTASFKPTGAPEPERRSSSSKGASRRNN